MLSILELKNRLPKDFIDELYTRFTPLTVDKILVGMLGDRNTTLRVNKIKCSIHELMKYLKENNIKFDRVLWYNDALVIKNVKEKQIKKLDIYDKGYLYLQSLSSMIPPVILDPKEGENVLDLTAAPGSKTTQMAGMMNNKGYILANELDAIRCESIGKEYKEYFDKVLLDAPCSGEGRFLGNNVQTYRNWSKKTVLQLSKLQKKLFKSAYDSLKKGGIMVYSTCTLNLQENEEVLDWAIKNLNIKLLDIDIEFKEKMQGFTEDVDSSIKKTIRILPSKDKEGFFVAKLKKI